MASVGDLSQKMCASPDYQAKVGKLAKPVCTLNDGRQVTHEDVAIATTTAFVKLRKDPKYALMCGAKPHIQKKRNKALKAAVLQDVHQQYGLPVPSKGFLLLVAAGALIGLIFGPALLFSVAIEAAFGWLVDKELTDNFDTVTG